MIYNLYSILRLLSSESVSVSKFTCNAKIVLKDTGYRHAPVLRCNALQLHFLFLVVTITKFLNEHLVKIFLRNKVILRTGGGDFYAAQERGDAADGLVVEVVHQAE